MNDAVAATFIFFLGNTPVGTVSLSWDASQGVYTYRSLRPSSHHPGGPWEEREFRTQLDAFGRMPDGRVPASLRLWRRPKVLGCEEVEEELSEKKGQSCAVRRAATDDEGTLYSEAYRARYERGFLTELTLADSRFVRTDQRAPQARWGDPFDQGFEVKGEGGDLRVDPPPTPVPSPSSLKGWDPAKARKLAQAVMSEAAGDDTCVDLARRYVGLARSTGGSALLVYGLFVPIGSKRAYGHAWVRVKGRGRTFDIDLTGRPVEPKTHYALAVASDGNPPEALGQTWLDILAGRRNVVRGNLPY